MPNGKTRNAAEEQSLTIFLCGDVMTGRGIDQVLPAPSPAELREPYVRNALDYVTLAERQNGDIPRPVRPTYIWGDALKIWDDVNPDVGIVNLETSITSSDDFWPGKGIHYRMAPANIRCLQGAKIDCCVLANNHVLDFGYAGLGQTITTLDKAGFHTTGAGRNFETARAPARIGVQKKGDVLVFSFADVSSGVPVAWRADETKAGINLLRDLTADTADRIAEQILVAKTAGDIVVVSIHWGGNWGYDIPTPQRDFAHCLIDRGAADIVHGHSSHHPKAIEIYQNKSIIYGCGDFITDYEGIGGHDEYRPWLSLMYFVTLNLQTGNLVALNIVPLRIHRMRLVRASTEERRWLLEMLNAQGKTFTTRFTLVDGQLELAMPVIPQPDAA